MCRNTTYATIDNRCLCVVYFLGPERSASLETRVYRFKNIGGYRSGTVVFKIPDPPGEGRGGEVGEVALSRLSRFSLSRAPTLSCRRPTRARLDAWSSSRPAPVTW